MKNIISAALLMIGGVICGAAAEPVTVRDISEVSNNKVYTLKRDGKGATQSGFLHVQATKKGSQFYVAAKADTTSANAQFSIHYSEREKAYYLYNLGAGLFASGDTKKKAVVTDAAAELIPVYNSLAKRWMLICGGYLLGMDDNNGFVLFLDNLNLAAAKAQANHFYIYEKSGVTLSDAEVAAIEDKVSAGREAVLKEYRTFLKNAASIVNTGDLPRYIGEYDVEELTYALDHDSEYSIKEIEEIYERTVLSRYPQEGRYYRIHNAVRPAARMNNILATAADGTIFSRELAEPAFGTATEGYSDDLNLFRVYYDGGDATRVKISAAAFGSYLTGGDNTEYTSMTSDIDDATVYTIEFPNVRNKKIYMSQESKGTWLTVSAAPECRLWSYNQKENPMEWYFEEVKTISVPVDANGYGSFCVPCGVQVPEGVKVYTVTDVSGGKAYVEEIDPLVHCYTPCIVKAAAGASTVELEVKNNTNWQASAMVGNVRATVSTPGRYVPTFSASGISFTYAPAEDIPSMPGSCYIVSDDQGALTTVMGANPNASIEEISAEDVDPANLYDLMGRKVSGTPRAGVYINATTHKAIRVK